MTDNISTCASPEAANWRAIFAACMAHCDTNLFLVRVWSVTADDENEHKGADDRADDNEDSDRNAKAKWQGKVQRVTDGEVQRFDNLQGLVDLLLTMLSRGVDR